MRPRRLVIRSTRTSSGLSTIPRTRCSTASTTTALISPSAFRRQLGLLATQRRRVRLLRLRRWLSSLGSLLAGDFFFGLVASVVGPPSAAANAALNTSSLLGLGAATFNRP